ncbi:MAG TPA: hypothetical protein PLB64_08105 [Kiritimatiellia bacterium]|jgi:hypothetical protein|nr:hypothetical protein [Kiritimatiellia bacterium]
MLRPLIAVLLALPLVALADSTTLDAQSARIESLLDMRHNAGFVRDPEQALEMADAMTEPEFLVAAMAMSANPEIWLKAVEQASAPDAPKNLARAANPDMLVEWFYSSIDPQFQQAIVSRMLDPRKPQRWMQSMANPRFYMHALAMMNPATPMQWMKVTADGRMIAPMQAWFDPKTYLNWMRLPAAETATGRKNERSTLPGFAWKPPQRY